MPDISTLTVAGTTFNIAGSGGTQSDWTEDDSSSPAYIKHKPSVYTISSTHDGNGNVTLIASVLADADISSY